MSLRIHVLCGGDSPEREVSLASGASVGRGLTEAGHHVSVRDLETSSDIFGVLSEPKPDLYFVALHGEWGEDGRLQSVLDMSGVPYTGSRPAGCAVAMDKWLSKKIFAAAGLEVPWGLRLRAGDEIDDVGDQVERWGSVIVKPCCGGSSVGVTVVSRRDELALALNLAWRHEPCALVESYIPGREISVAILEESGIPRALPAVEILPPGGLYDYSAKYDGKSRYRAPAELATPVAQWVARSAEEAHRAAGCGVYSRVDMRLDEESRPWILEVNTAPGMTDCSLVPKAAQAEGIAFSDLLNRIVLESLREQVSNVGIS
ncbi:MAG: D-alanine--D-alanine ligase [Dethiosulfovibrio peptidovorans]|nr:MAG: D-alanine--D-alanine ligase [Dethiosulfovibrio peptidovorans]